MKNTDANQQQTSHRWITHTPTLTLHPHLHNLPPLKTHLPSVLLLTSSTLESEFFNITDIFQMVVVLRQHHPAIFTYEQTIDINVEFPVATYGLH